MKFTCSSIHYTYYKTPNETDKFSFEADNFTLAKFICVDMILVRNPFFDFAIDNFKLTDENGVEMWDWEL